MSEQEYRQEQEEQQQNNGMSFPDEADSADNQEVPRNPPGEERLRQILEGLLIVAGKPLSLDAMQAIFAEHEMPDRDQLRDALATIGRDCEDRGFELKEVASGFRFQVRESLGPWISRLWEEKPQRYSRAMLETLALIAYRQPITRGDIEEIRGVGVSSTIIRTLLDREWIRVVGHRDVPGRPAMFATTRQFLDYFDLKSLQELPPLSEIRDLDQLNGELELEDEGGDGRVLELPEENGGDRPSVERNEQEEADTASGPSWSEEELPDEEEAMALAKRPLDDILSNPDLGEQDDENEPSDSDGEQK